MTPRPIASTFALLLAGGSLLVAGCGEEPRVFKDPSEMPPISADAAAEVRDQDAAVADAERAESSRIAPARPRR